MDPETIFKKFFGASFPEIDHRQFRPVEGEGDSSGQGESRRHGTDQFGSWHRWHLEQKQAMMEMQQHLHEAFRFFSIPSFEPSAVLTFPDGSGETETKPDSESTARDQMLKEGNGSNHPAQAPEQPSHPFSGFIFSPLFEEFTGTPHTDRIPPKERKDHDIDSESPDKDEIVDIYHRSRDPFGHFFSSGRSMNMKTVIGANGVIEERSTMKDSSGREETTVTRRLGDQCHTVTTIKDEKGQEETRETFQNIDKDKMLEFEQQWQGKGNPAEPVTTDPDRAVLLPSKPGGTLSDNRGFFRKMFGF